MRSRSAPSRSTSSISLASGAAWPARPSPRAPGEGTGPRAPKGDGNLSKGASQIQISVDFRARAEYKCSARKSRPSLLIFGSDSRYEEPACTPSPCWTGARVPRRQLEAMRKSAVAVRERVAPFPLEDSRRPERRRGCSPACRSRAADAPAWHRARGRCGGEGRFGMRAANRCSRPGDVRAAGTPRVRTPQLPPNPLGHGRRSEVRWPA